MDEKDLKIDHYRERLLNLEDLYATARVRVTMQAEELDSLRTEVNNLNAVIAQKEEVANGILEDRADPDA